MPMEGLIPYVYRAIKRRRTRRYYRCLSSGTAQLLPAPKFLSPPPPEAPRGYRGENHAVHRRHRSMEGFSTELSPDRFLEQRRLGKGSSFRGSRMFACIAGA